MVEIMKSERYSEVSTSAASHNNTSSTTTTVHTHVHHHHTMMASGPASNNSGLMGPSAAFHHHSHAMTLHPSLPRPIPPMPVSTSTASASSTTTNPGSSAGGLLGQNSSNNSPLQRASLMHHPHPGSATLHHQHLQQSLLARDRISGFDIKQNGSAIQTQQASSTSLGGGLAPGVNGVTVLNGQTPYETDSMENDKWWWVCCLEFCFCLL